MNKLNVRPCKNPSYRRQTPATITTEILVRKFITTHNFKLKAAIQHSLSHCRKASLDLFFKA